MCGIAALYEPSAPPWLWPVAQQMTRLVRHRGPDGEGFVGLDRAGQARALLSEESPAGASGGREPLPAAVLVLGHRRLSILDLSAAGHQPMADADGRCWITFNGEIYNFLELRAELGGRGHRFHTGTDTEVILAAWREWGEDCLARFNGMFAFILVDRARRRFFAARDRFGVKPLYLWATPGGGVAFASEIKQFTAHPGWKPAVHGQRAYDFLNRGIIDHTRDTLFAGVRQLRGGEFLAADLDGIATATPRRWYDLKPAPFTGDFAAAAGRFRELLDDSVRLRLRADVPTGSCLSGGLDSSSIVCTVRAQLGERATELQNTFSAFSDVPRFDESRYIRDVAAVTRAREHSVIPSPQVLFEEIDALTWAQDEPFGSTSIFAQWCVFRLARQNGVIVMLDGQGADEALGGYHGYFGPRLAGLLRRGRLGTFWREAKAVRSLHGQTWSLQLRFLANDLLAPSLMDPLRRLTGRTSLVPPFLDLRRLGAEPRALDEGLMDLRDPVRSLGVAQLTALSLPMLLHCEDRDSMAHGVEARLPFLDYRLVEFCLGVPEDFKIADGWTKRILREGMRGRLPESVRQRRDKLGFATAEEVWMRELHQAEFSRLAEDAIAAADGVFTPAARTKVDRMLAGAEPFSFYIWRLISFGRWLRRFAVRLPA